LPPLSLNSVYNLTTGKMGRLIDSDKQSDRATRKVIFVSAGKVWDSQKEVSAIFNELHGELHVCDPYYRFP